MAAPPLHGTLLDQLLASHDHRTLHGRSVPASVAAVARAIETTPVDDARVARVLLGARTLGRSFREPAGPISELGDGAPGFLQIGRSATEIVVGFVGRPWPGGDPVDAVADAAGWRSFAATDAVKVALSIRCGAAAYGTLLVIETRIACGRDAAQPFERYWRLVRPGSDLVRRSLLRAIARQATEVNG